MDFPIAESMDEDACYAKIVAVLHPGGLVRPRCGIGDRSKVHRRRRAPVIGCRCEARGRVFNALTGTESHKAHRSPTEILPILRGISRGTSAARLARELSRHRPHLLRSRHRLQAKAMGAADTSPPAGDAEVEADEMYQDAGEKGIHHPGPDDPPRRRANKRRGHGNFANDRPPVAGVAGRDSGRLRARVVKRTDRATPEAFVGDSARPGAMIYSDELSSYAYLQELGFGHATACHVAHEWARDDDGDGIREVHDNTPEGIWTGLRNYLRIFRGVSKHYLAQYVAVFLWSYNIKAVTDGSLRVLMGTRA
jgi:ISXO2 transposase-like protein